MVLVELQYGEFKIHVKKIECDLVYTLTLYSGAETEYADDIVERPNKYQNDADMLFVKGSMWDAINKEDVASCQYDVDDLLSGLGF